MPSLPDAPQLVSSAAPDVSAALLQSILETAPDAIVITDHRGVVERFSAAAEQLFDRPATQIVGRDVAMLMTEFDAVSHDRGLARYLAAGGRQIIGNDRRVIGRRRDGSLFPLALTVREARIGERRIFIGYLRDLTAHEAGEDRMIDFQAELLRISRVSAMGTMATALAHELNQPLTVIANYVQSSCALIASEAEGALALVRDALEEAGREVLRAGGIVNRLREFVAGGDLDRTIVPLRVLALETCELGGVGGRARGIVCDVTIAPQLAPVLVDRVHIQQVLLNLIRNAMDAMEERGIITISAQPDQGMMRVSVSDTGSGIPPGKEEELFQFFVSTKANGMGMGLAICRAIIEAHGGRIWCRNLPEGGAAFHFTLPIAEVDDE